MRALQKYFFLQRTKFRITFGRPFHLRFGKAFKIFSLNQRRTQERSQLKPITSTKFQWFLSFFAFYNILSNTRTLHRDVNDGNLAPQNNQVIFNETACYGCLGILCGIVKIAWILKTSFDILEFTIAHWISQMKFYRPHSWFPKSTQMTTIP